MPSADVNNKLKTNNYCIKQCRRSMRQTWWSGITFSCTSRAALSACPH